MLKCATKKINVTIEGIVPKWPLITLKETALEYDKINNCAMIRPTPFVTIEDQLPSVRTVINMLHFLNQLIVYTIWKLVFSKLSKITPLTCSPFINTMYVTTWPISKRGNKWEMLSYKAWTDGRTGYAIISPYFDGRIKMNGPYPEITNISFLAKLFFKTFISLKQLSDCRTIGPSDYRTVGLSDCRIIATAP